jgi:hypothetical protein
MIDANKEESRLTKMEVPNIADGIYSSSFSWIRSEIKRVIVVPVVPEMMILNRKRYKVALEKKIC